MDTMNVQRVVIDGIETDCSDIRTRHGKDQPIGSGSITIPGPLQSHVQPDKSVRIELGYGADTQLVFLGRTSDDTRNFTDMGTSTRVAIEGYGKRLWYGLETEAKILGPIALHRVFNTFAKARAVPYYLADPFVDADGVALLVGGNTKLDNAGYLVIDAERSPGSVIDRIARLFGYCTFDSPNGWHRFARISGLPNTPSVRSYVEGVNVLSIERRQSLKAMVNYWEIVGPAWTAADGTETEIFERPSAPTLDPRLGPSGKNKRTLRDDEIVSQALAIACREVMEIDYAAPQLLYSVTIPGDADLQVGDNVMLSGSVVGGTVKVWITDIAHASSGQGWTTSLECWAGRGKATPSPAPGNPGSDCVSLGVLTGSRHLGDDVLGNYQRPNPDGVSWSMTFSAPSKSRSISLAGWAHGANSQPQLSTWSRVELRQGGVVKASANLPRQAEQDGVSFSSGSTWPAISLALSGEVEAGTTEIRVLAGTPTTGGYDDFEIRDLTVRLCGVGSDPPGGLIIALPARPRR